MKQNINIEAEGNELILKNKAGDYVIVPKKYRLEVQDMIKENCHGCIDKLVETLPMMEDYALDGSVIPNDKKNNFEYKSYTAVQDNTYVAPRVVIPLEQKKKQQFVPREQPVLKADTRTDQERKIAQEYIESVLNPSIRTQIGEALQKPLRWMADPVKGVGDIVSAFAPNSPLAKDLPNTNEETFEYRKKRLNPYTSNKEKRSNTINEAIPLTNWALLNTLPIEAAAGNMIKSSKKLIKPMSKVVGKMDDVKIFNSILDNPKEIEAITNNIKDISKEDIIKLEEYLKDTYDYENLTPWQKNKLLDRESYYLKKNNISVSDRIENNKKLLNFWEDYKKERKTYFESPKFRERLEKQVGKMDDKAFNKYKSNLLNNLEKRPYIRPDVVADYSAAHYKPKSHIGISEHSPGHTYYTDKTIEKRIVEHEGRHQLTNADDVIYGFPSQQELEANLVHPDLLSIDADFIKNIGEKTGVEYFLSPEEFIVRLDELKRDLSKVGYDYMTEDLTPEILKKYKGITPKEAIHQVTGKSYGVRLNELLPEQREQVLQLLENNIEIPKDASRLLRWFKEDFLINQINNKWGLIPPAIGSGMYLQSQNKNEQ